MKRILLVIGLLCNILYVFGQINQADNCGRKYGKWVRVLDKSEKIINVYNPCELPLEIFKYQRYVNRDSSYIVIETAKITEFFIDDMRNGDFYIHLNDSVLFVKGKYKNDTVVGLRQIYKYDQNGVLFCSDIEIFNDCKPVYVSIGFYNDEILFRKINPKQKSDYFLFYDLEGKVSGLDLVDENDESIRSYILRNDEENTMLLTYKNETKKYINYRLVDYNTKDYSKGFYRKISFFERIADVNYWHVLFNKKKLKRKYGIDIRVKL